MIGSDDGLGPQEKAAQRGLETKRAPGALALDGDTGEFRGYASLWGLPDLGKDVVEPGAFRDSLGKRGAAGVRMLWQHDPAQPIGRWLALAEDARGLKVHGRLNLAVARARELHALLREGALDGLSIGFKAVKARNAPRTGLRHLVAVDLWEISLVTFPMLPQARVAMVKSAGAGGLAASIRAAARRIHS